MIRPATELLRQNPGRTAFVIAIAAAALIVPGAVWFGSGSAAQLTRHWIEEFRPVVYLAPSAGDGSTEELADRVSGWSSVESVEVRTPDAAWEQARKRLGEKALSDIGVEPSMFPYSLVVEPSAGGAPGVDLIARLEALETRETVESVDVPSQKATRMLGWFRWGMILGGLSLIAGLAFAVHQMADFLRRLRREEASELALLERFGAEPSALRRSTWIRGLVVGIWAGVVAFGILLAVGVAWQNMTSELFGAMSADGYRQWMAVGAPLVLGPLAGTFVGLWVARRDGNGGEPVPGLESLLEHS